MSRSLSVSDALLWGFMLIFVLLGVLNLILVHPVPGLFYLLISLCYCPPLLGVARKFLGFSLPYLTRVIGAFLVLWATLAVGDLAELYGL